MGDDRGQGAVEVETDHHPWLSGQAGDGLVEAQMPRALRHLSAHQKTS
jgi:hypothetical protein